MFDAVHHVGYVVPDLDEALELFRDKLGMTEVKTWASAAEGNRCAALRVGHSDTYLELICPVDETKSAFAAHLREHGPSVHHVAFRDHALDQTLEILADQAGIGGTEPVISSSGWRMSFLDPQATQGLSLQLVDGRHG